MDADDDGAITVQELQKGLQDLTGKSLKKKHIKEMISSVSDSGDSSVDYKEFIEVFKRADR
eukprot:COSAG06_NODE_28687_length_570_cov_0.346072_1_plen_60_part_01